MFSRWHRDIEVAQFIEHMEDESRKLQWDRLTPQEMGAVAKELERCRGDFVYAARNYFWITNKDLQDQLLALNQAQELILQKVLEIKGKGKAQKILIIKGRQLGCSTFIEALVAWRTMFFSNVNALVTSYDRPHTCDVLYPIMVTIYERMPWWLRPMCRFQTKDEGILFQNPNKNENVRIGNKSQVYVKAANTTTSVGTGIRLSAFHFCFSPNTLIHVGDGSVKPITEVVAGDRVFTSKGEATTVKNVWQSTRTNELTSEIWLWGMCAPLSTTRDHPIFTPTGFKPSCQVKRGEYVRMPVRKITNGVTHLDYVDYTQGQKPNRTSDNRISRGTDKKLAVNFDTGYYFGLYLAEGCMVRKSGPTGANRPCNIIFGVHEKETEYVTKKIKLALGQDQHIKPRKSDSSSKTVSIQINGGGMARLVEKEFGSKDTKRIPDWAWDCGEEFCKGIVCGYLEGDGHLTHETCTIPATSTRVAIPIQIRSLIASLGYGWSGLHYKPSGQYYGRNCKEAWTLVIAGNAAVSLREAMGWPERKGTEALHWKYSEDKKFIDIEVSEIADGVADRFYDLEVEAPEHDFCTIHCCVKNSEFAQVDGQMAHRIIDKDVRYALVDGPGTFAILESTAKGANTYAHKLWKKCEEMAERADWYPLFLPAFFESRRAVIILPVNWHIKKEEFRMRESVMDHWLRCDNKECRQYQQRRTKFEDRAETICPTCNVGILHPYSMTDKQLCFMEELRLNAERDDEAIKKLKQELCVTPLESFQLEGIQVFGQKAQDFANSCARDPIAVGDFDAGGKLHGVNPKGRLSLGLHGEYRACFQDDCELDHRWDDNPLQIWEWPIRGAIYNIGADVAEGGGEKSEKSAYSAAVCIRFSHHSEPNEHVATWRSNTIDPISYAGKLNWLGRYYNDAQIAVEVNKYDSCLSALRFNMQYSNLYRWKNIDSVNPLTNKYGWETNMKSRPRLWQTFRIWLQHELFLIRSKNICQEMQNFVKGDIDDIYAEGDKAEKDDELFGAMISLFTANEALYHEGLGLAAPRRSLSIADAKFVIHCQNCGHDWPEMVVDQKIPEPQIDDAGNITQPASLRCPACHSIRVSVKRNLKPAMTDGSLLVAEVTHRKAWLPEDAWADYQPKNYDSFW